MTIGLPAIIAIGALFVTFVTYVASVQRSQGRLEAKVEANEKDIEMLQLSSATKEDMAGIRDQLTGIQKSIDKLFDLDRERNAR
jgi:hypothetical protein